MCLFNFFDLLDSHHHKRPFKLLCTLVRTRCHTFQLPTQWLAANVARPLHPRLTSKAESRSCYLSANIPELALQPGPHPHSNATWYFASDIASATESPDASLFWYSDSLSHSHVTSRTSRLIYIQQPAHGRRRVRCGDRTEHAVCDLYNTLNVARVHPAHRSRLPRADDWLGS